MLRGLTTVAYSAFDHEGARRWYADLLGVEPYFDRPGYTEFRIGDYQHELGIVDAAQIGTLGGEAPATEMPGGAIVYWHVDDVQATLARLEAMGATVHHPPRNFGEDFIGASVIDPFGNILGIMQNPHYLAVLANLAAR